ncbi:MAG: TolC family protein [Campylobacterales bacterium]|nr:TolC family protein [Campylobacterales bacterium]
MRLSTTFFFFLLSMNASALTLEEAINKTLKSHPDGQIASLQYESSMETAKGADSALYPRIDANANYFPTKTFVIPINGTFSTKQSNSFHGDISGSYALWDFGRSRDRYTSALHSQEGADSTKKLTQNELVEKVWNTYYGVAVTASLIDTADASVKFYESEYKQSLNMRKSGLKTEADELRFKASLLESQDRVVRAKIEYDKAALSLGILIGSDDPVSVNQSSLDQRCETLSLQNISLETLRQELRDNNPQLKALRSSIHSAKDLSDAASHEKYGNVALVGSYGYDDSLSAYDSYQAGVMGTIPLYDGGKLSAEAQKSRIAYTIAQKEFENTERQLWQEVYGAYRDFKRTDESIKSKESVIEATLKSLHLIGGRYAQGLATYVDVLESQSTLENAKSDLAQAKYQKISAYAHVKKLLNQGDGNDKK